MEAVRVVQPADRAEWLRMRHSLWPHGELAEHGAEIDQYFVESGLGVVFVAPRPTDGLQGFVEVGIRTYAEGCATSHVGYIEGWYVDADVRRQGVGQALIAAAEAWAVMQGCTEMGSDTELHNVVSQAAHTRLGYVETERLVHFRKLLPGS